MCYSIEYQESQQKKWKTHFGERAYFPPVPNIYSGFSRPMLPVLVGNSLDLMQWTLIPSWVKDPNVFITKANTLNAKVETVAELKTYKNLIGNRCLLLVDAYIEYQWEDETNSKSKKTKFRLFQPDEDFTALACIYSPWINPDSGEKIGTFSILTTEAIGIARAIHNSKKRMPIMLNSSEYSLWLEGSDPQLFADRSDTALQAEPV